MPNNYHIRQELNRVYKELSDNGLPVRGRTSRRGVPHLVVNEEVSLCFFWSTKRWKAFEWMTPDNRTITEKAPDKIVSFVLNHFNEDDHYDELYEKEKMWDQYTILV